jgi:sulfite oxidase
MALPLSRRRWLQISALAAGVATLRGTGALAADAPVKSEGLLVRSQDPYNAEPPLEKLAAEAVTPIEHFYVRNHGPTPKLDAAEVRLSIEGLVHKPVVVALDELHGRFAEEEVAATLTCAGNRRREMSEVKPVGGVQWEAGAIGHANWTGANLWQVLEMAELKAGAKHVWFEGLDPIKEKDGSIAPFGGSIPLARALDKRQPAILAHRMNGGPLAPEHGYPLRTVVPGYIGARSVKWLTKITVSDRPSPNHYVAEAYKLVQSDAKEEMAMAEPIYSFPINAAICWPAAGAMLKAGDVAVSGYALPPGDGKTTIAKVELSTDGGRNWVPAKLDGQAAPSCWQLWTAKVKLAAGDHTLIVRAIDSAGNSQPQRPQWNFKGYLHNAWHRCQVKVV